MFSIRRVAPDSYRNEQWTDAQRNSNAASTDFSRILKKIEKLDINQQRDAVLHFNVCELQFISLWKLKLTPFWSKQILNFSIYPTLKVASIA